MKNQLILIIDTAHPTARIIIANDREVLGMREWPNTPKIGTELLIYIDGVVRELGRNKADVTRIAVHAGPGSYGLVRTGIIAATILAQAVEAELVETSGEKIAELVENARRAEERTPIEPRYR